MEVTAATENNTLEISVPETNWSKLEETLSKIESKARKLGLRPVVCEVLEEYEEAKDLNRIDYKTGKRATTLVRYRKVRLTGEAPCVVGWAFVATITPAEGVEGNFIRRTPGYDREDLPVEFRNCSLRCDHCHTVRARKDNFAIRNVETGEWKLVGRNCLADFLNKDLVDLFAILEWWGTLESLSLFDEGDYFGGGGGLWRFETITFLIYAFHYARTVGWMSRSEAKDDVYNVRGQATADDAWALLMPSYTAQEQASKTE